MRILQNVALTLALLLSAAVVSATTISGTFKYNGTPFNGSMTIQLSYPAGTGTYVNLPIASGPIPINNGVFAPFAVDGNDVLLPKKTYYAVSLADQYGAKIATLNYYISGSSFDLGTAVPTPILTNNINLLDLLGLRSLSVQSLSILSGGSFSLGIMSLSSSGISSAQTINNIEFSYAFNIANPSSTTCGIQEAENALPSTGGLIILQSGSCSVSSTVSIAVPTTFIGFGSGNYTTSSHTAISAPTLLTNATGSTLFSISPTSTINPLSQVVFRDFSVTVPSSPSGTAFSIGNSSLTPASIKSVSLDHISTFGCVSSVSVVGNVNSISISSSSFLSGTNGLTVTAASGYSVGSIYIDRSFFLNNTNDGVYLNSNFFSAPVMVTNSHFESNNNGVEIASGSTTAQLSVTGSLFKSNTSSGILFSDGFGHTVNNNTITNNGVYGVNISTPNTTGTGSITVSLKDNVWGSNSSNDIFVGPATIYTLLYPQTTTSYTLGGTTANVKYIIATSSGGACTQTNKTGSYLSGITYTNSTGHSLIEEVTVSLTGTSGTGGDYQLDSIVGGLTVPAARIANSCQGNVGTTYVVPPGDTFSSTANVLSTCSPAGTWAIISWVEISGCTF